MAHTHPLPFRSLVHSPYFTLSQFRRDILPSSTAPFLLGLVASNKLSQPLRRKQRGRAEPVPLLPHLWQRRCPHRKIWTPRHFKELAPPRQWSSSTASHTQGPPRPARHHQRHWRFQ